MDNATTKTTAIVPVTPCPETKIGDQDNMQEHEMVRAIMQTGNTKFIAKVQSGKITISDAYQQVMASRGEMEPMAKPQETPGAESQEASSDPKIDPDIRDCLPEISTDALELLESLIIDRQIFPVVTVWQGYVLDGHHTKDICDQHGLSYQVVAYEASNKLDAIIHRIEVHLGRRHISLFARIALCWKLERYYREKARQNKKLGQGKKALTKNGQSFQRVDTVKKIAELAHAGNTPANQVRRGLESGYQDLIDQAMRGELKPNHAYFQVRDRQKKKDRDDAAHQVVPFANPTAGEYINQIIQGDCHEILPKIAQDVEHKVTSFIFSPPYNIGLDYGLGSKADQRPYSEYIDDLLQSILLQSQCLRDGGRICCNIGLSSVPQKERDQDGDFIRVVDCDLIQGVRKLDCGLRLLGKIIWSKTNRQKCFPHSQDPILTNLSLHNDFEYVLIWAYKIFDLPNVTGQESDILTSEYDEWMHNPWNIHTVNHSVDHPAKCRMNWHAG